MDVLEAVRVRRSIRKYKADDVSEDILDEILHCARLAPSAGNRQPWTFIAVRSSEVKEGLMEASGGQSQVGQAPVVIVVCIDPEISGARYGDRGRSLYVFQDSGAAVQNMLLAATHFGLGTCWVGAFDEKKASEVLDLHFGLRPVTLIPLGYPDEEPQDKSFRPKDKVLFKR